MQTQRASGAARRDDDFSIPLPPGGWHRRQPLAQLILQLLLEADLSGIHARFEARRPC